jgi:hypothetical protein
MSKSGAGTRTRAGAGSGSGDGTGSISGPQGGNRPLFDPWEKIPLTVKHAICLAVLLLLPTFLFPDVFWGDSRFVAHDTIQWRASAESIIAERNTTGEEPLWAANQFSGMPAYLVSYQKSVPNIDNILTLPETLYPASFFWVLLVGMYLFLIRLGFKPASSMLGSVLAGFSTYLPIIVGAGHNSKFVALSFIPWVMLGYAMLRDQDRNKWLSAFVFTGAFILHLRAGHPQITYYFMWLLGIWFLYDVAQAWKEGRIKPFASVAALVIVSGLVTLVANAQPYWSIYEYSPFSIRGGGGADSPGGAGLDMEYAFRWSQGWGELLTLFLPNAYGGSAAYWGPKSGTSGPHYFGAITMVFLLLGLWKSDFKLKWVFFGAGAITVLFSLGEHFMAFNTFMFNYFPLFNKFRAPETWLVVAGFCFPVVAVAGIEYVAKKTGEIKKSDWLPAMIPVVVLAVVAGLGISSILSFEKPGQADQFIEQLASANQLNPSDSRVQQQVRDFIENNLKPERKALAERDGLRFLFIVTLSVAVLLGLAFRKLGAGPATLILVMIAGYDGITVGQRYSNDNSMVPKDFDAQRTIEQTRRPLDTWLAENVNTSEPWSYRVFPLSDNPFNNALPSYFYPSLGGYSGARMAIYDDIMSRSIFVGDFGLNIGLMNMLNTKYLTYNEGLELPGFMPVHESDGVVVYENSNVLPKAWFVDKAEVVLNKDNALARINQFTFDPSREAVVEYERLLPELTADSTATATVTSYSARQIDVDVSRSSGSGLLVLGELYYPQGWVATIDGEPAEILKTNFAIRGVIVPEGTHTVSFTFDPRSHTAGTTVAWVGHLMWLLMGGIALVFHLRGGRKSE